MKIDLNDIHSPKDIKKMNIPQLELLSEELRCVLLKKLAAHGGHVGPNLGVVEATVALHYVFDAPEDKIVFDVSHQTYIHKMLTGRIEAFTDPKHYDDVTGYTSPAESGYDLFEIGHTSTSISLATGLAKARDLKGEHENVVAFIGDASLGGGMALEALNYAPTLKSNFIVILNDNQMSIAENHGELYNHLTELRQSNGTSDNNIFRALGYEYIYVREGNNIKELIEAFRSAKDRGHAVVIHINTMKGMGYPCAEKYKERFHYSSPFNLESGTTVDSDSEPDYADIFADKMLAGMEKDSNLVVLNAGTPASIGFDSKRREAAGKQFVDVGIAEQDCVAMTAGLARGGARPVMGVVATFLQRAYDQLSHDLALNHLPAVIVDFYGSLFGMKDATHLGFFDIAMVSNIPGITMLAPASKEEFEAMIDHYLDHVDHPVVIRVPGGKVMHADQPVNIDFSRYDIIEKGEDVALIGEGPFLWTALEAAAILREKGIDPTVINPRILSDIDAECLDSLSNYRKIITIEDGIIDGGFGQKIAAYMGPKNVEVVCLGLKKEFADRYNVKELLETNRLTAGQIAEEACMIEK